MEEKFKDQFKALKKEITSELDYKVAELADKQTGNQPEKNLFKSPVFISVISGIIGAMALLGGKLLDNSWNRDSQQIQYERTLILKAIETPDLLAARQNIDLLIDARLITNSDIIRALNTLKKSDTLIFQSSEIYEKLNSLTISNDSLKKLNDSIAVNIQKIAIRNQELDSANTALQALVTKTKDDFNQLLASSSSTHNESEKAIAEEIKTNFKQIDSGIMNQKSRIETQKNQQNDVKNQQIIYNKYASRPTKK